MKLSVGFAVKLVLLGLLSSSVTAAPLSEGDAQGQAIEKRLETEVDTVVVYKTVTETVPVDKSAHGNEDSSQSSKSEDTGHTLSSSTSNDKKKHRPKHQKHPHRPKHQKHPHHPKHPKHKYPFYRVVAFGDNLSDNGNGSYAHGVASIGEPHNTIYGHRTWTNGPVAVSYLVDMLGMPLAIDYAFGHAQGGSRIGATISDSYTKSEYAPDGFTQVRNYTQTSNFGPKKVKNTLHFVWIGNNDINLLHLSAATWNNTGFGVQMAKRMTELIGNLVHFGAEHIFVPGLYAKQLSPSWHFYAKNLTERAMLGHAIKQANTAIREELHKQYGEKVTFYDVAGFMEHVWANHKQYGLTHIGTNKHPAYCDGETQKNWDMCVTHHHGDRFYWMQFLDMTTRVHQLIAQDMHRALRKRFLG